MVVPYRESFGHGACLRVKVIWTDLKIKTTNKLQITIINFENFELIDKCISFILIIDMCVIYHFYCAWILNTSDRSQQI